MPLMFPREVAVFQLQMSGREAGLLVADSPEAGLAVHGSQAGPGLTALCSAQGDQH